MYFLKTLEKEAEFHYQTDGQKNFLLYMNSYKFPVHLRQFRLQPLLRNPPDWVFNEFYKERIPFYKNGYLLQQSKKNHYISKQLFNIPF